MLRRLLLLACLSCLIFITATCNKDDENGSPTGSNVSDKPGDSTDPEDSTVPIDTGIPADTTTPGDSTIPIDTTIPADTGTAPWNHTYGTIFDDYATAVTVDASGKIYVAGDIYDQSGGSNALVMCLDRDGNVIWQTAIDHSLNESSCAIFVDPDGSLLVVGTALESGTSQGRIFLSRLDNTGTESSFDLLSQPTGVMPIVNETFIYTPYEPYRPMSSVKVERIPGGGFIFAGDSYYTDNDHSGTRAAFVMKADETGNEIWTRYFVGISCWKPDFHEEGTGSAQAVTFDPTSSETTIAWYYLTHTGSNIHDCGEPQIYSELCHLNQNGVTLWKKTVGKECPVRATVPIGQSQIGLFPQCPPKFRLYSLSMGDLTTSDVALPANILLKSAVLANGQIAVTGFVSPIGGLYWAIVSEAGSLIGEDFKGTSDRASGNAMAVSPVGQLIIVGNIFTADSSMQAYVVKVNPL